jgi:hypothetical protein
MDSRRRHRCAGRAGRNHALCVAFLHQLRRHVDRRSWLFTEGAGGVFPHPDHLRGLDYGETGAVSGELGFDDLGDPDENHLDTASSGVNRAGNGLFGGVVAPHGVEGDPGQGSGGLDHLAAAVCAALTTGAMG